MRTFLLTTPFGAKYEITCDGYEIKASRGIWFHCQGRVLAYFAANEWAKFRETTNAKSRR